MTTQTELMRMALTGLSPETRAIIKRAAERQIREYDGSLQMVPYFIEGLKVLQVIQSIEGE